MVVTKGICAGVANLAKIVAQYKWECTREILFSFNIFLYLKK